MSKDGDISGRWLLYGPNEEALPGTLRNDETITLTISAPHNKTLDEMFISTVGIGERDVPLVILGFDEYNKPVKLFGCHSRGGSVTEGLRRWDIDVQVVVKGMDIASLQAPVAHALLIRFKYLHRWLGDRLPVLGDDVDAHVAKGGENDVLFEIGSGVRFRIASCIAVSSTADDSSIKHDTQVWFHFESPYSPMDILKRWIPWAQDLLGLLTGELLSIEEVAMYSKDPYEPSCGPHENGQLISGGWASGRLATEYSLHPATVLVPFDSIRHGLNTVVLEWNRVFRTLQPVVSLFRAVVLERTSQHAAHFLSVVQALEIYHSRSSRFLSRELPMKEVEERIAEVKRVLPEHLRDWVLGKLSIGYRPLSLKLADLFRDHESETVRLFGDLEVAASRIAYTRNHLAHHMHRVNTSRLISDTELSVISLSLEAVLKIILLREIGVGEDCRRRVIQKAEGLQTVNME